MKPVRSKKDMQSELEAQVQAFVASGGNINQVERGKSGLDHEKPWINPFKSGETEKSPPRTPVPDVIAAIDARKSPKKNKPKRRSKPTKKWILDDFGEPVRWVWSDES
ncbi:hypothetical protein [Reinekea marinisedimentorum]|uniref:Transcriptional regulator SutA RNAP-binding domain-containing protein n=1 Tax=Reinekea marinisedimentorum TaxID=230495 RepID=A0A4R3I7S1_9GAMM|nr:hypothetical protein [Reinekea marinisedimentorum]TCS40181.1 hypothetical protein BCF53_110103 [Reinekea marinisedimentorum]